MEMTPEIKQRLEALEKKYNAMGQDLVSYLDGLLHADFLTYWDYIHIDTLLSLQNPRTSFPDEEIFIIYHQITELYFKLCMNEFSQLSNTENPDLKFFMTRVARINSYFENLVRSFEIMVAGMEHDQFLKFRMSLLPASGFQSAQYRMIEICATDFIYLVSKDKRNQFKSDSSISEMFDVIYWKAGATELASGKKTLTLQQFEEKYSHALIKLAEEKRANNLWQVYKKAQFSADCVVPLRAACKLRIDYDLDLFTVALLMGYLNRIDGLERQLQSLRAELPQPRTR